MTPSAERASDFLHLVPLTLPMIVIAALRIPVGELLLKLVKAVL
jgi:hypothetical protein